MARQLAIGDRTDLSFYSGWEGCYVDWRPANYVEQQKLIRAQLNGIEDAAAELLVVELVKARIVGGKVKILDKDGKPQLANIEPDDIDTLPSAMTDRIVADMMGVKYDADPLEETPTATESSTDTPSTKPQTTTSTTETLSSEA